MKRIFWTVSILIICSAIAYSGLITKSKTFSTGETIEAGDFNSLFDQLFNEINGSLSNANISGSAAIDDTKLALTDIAQDITFNGVLTLAGSSQTIRLSSLLLAGSTILATVSTGSRPPYSFDGDPNTGMFSTGSDSISFGVGGTEKIRINSGGLGISTQPGHAFDVVGSEMRMRSVTTDLTAKDAVLLLGHSDNSEENILWGGALATGSGNSLFYGGGVADYNTATSVSIYTAASTTTLIGSLRLYVASDGNIGTTGCADPDHDLTVGGSGTNCDTGTYSEIDAGEATFTVSSDRDLKENIRLVNVPPNYLTNFKDTKIYDYDFKDELANGKPVKRLKNKRGLMADEIQSLMPGRGHPRKIKGDDITAALWLAIQELIIENESLKARLQAAGIP